MKCVPRVNKIRLCVTVVIVVIVIVMCPVDPLQIIQAVVHPQTCKTSLAASSRAEFLIMYQPMEASSLKEHRLIRVSELPLGLQECFQDLLHKRGSLAQQPNGASPTNTGLREESRRVDVRKSASHSSTERGSD